MNYTYLAKTAKGSFTATLIVALVIMASYFTLEPVVSRSSTEIFTVTQTISGAISFMASTSPVTMVGTLDGLTGGTSYGTTTSRVRTNNATGYNMTIVFASTSPMIRNGGSGYISTYKFSSSTASYDSGFDTTAANAQFGFSVNASNTTEISPVFTHSGALCGTSNNGSFTVNNCWRGASSTNETATTQLILTSAPTPSSGSTTTVQFRITIPNNPNPVVPDGTYTATATLTATDN
jgi:hypothetical protein